MDSYLFVTFILIIGVEIIHGQEGPKVAPFSSHVKPVIGGKTSFICQSLSGSSPLQIVWLKDGKEIEDSSEFRIVSIPDSSVLMLESIKSSHSGNYTCRIANRYGHDSYTTELTVEGPPSWIEKPNHVKSKIHHMVNIRCIVSGYPKPTITWKKYQGSSWTQSGVNGLNKDSLLFMNITKKQEGRYGCLASNGIEPDLWSEFEVSVEGEIARL